MAFFDKVKETLSSAGDTISNATNKAQQSLKTMQAVGSLNSQINAKQEAIRAAYLAIGQAYAANHPDDAEPEYAEHVAVIAAANAEIADMQAQIAALKGVVTCPSCGGQIPDGAAFCPNCGTKAPEPEAPIVPEEPAAFCPNCGAQLEGETAFCPNCGTKIG